MPTDGGVTRGGGAVTDRSAAVIAILPGIAECEVGAANLDVVTAFNPGEVVGDVESAARRIGIDATAIIAEFGVVFGVGLCLFGTRSGESGEQGGGSVAIGQQGVWAFSKVADVDAQGEVIQQVVLDGVVTAEAPILEMPELLKSLGQGAGDGPGEGIAVEVLAAEHTVDAELVAEVVVSLNGVNALPGTGGARAVVADAGVVEYDVGTVGKREVLEDFLGYGADAIGADDVDNAVAGQGFAVVGIGDDIAAGIDGIKERNHCATGVGIAAKVAVAEIGDGQRLEAAAAVVLRAGAFTGEKEECFVPAIVDLGNENWAAEIDGFYVLPLNGFASGGGAPEEAFGVQLFMA